VLGDGYKGQVGRVVRRVPLGRPATPQRGHGAHRWATSSRSGWTGGIVTNCKEDGCPSSVFSGKYQWCQSHYDYWRRHGKPDCVTCVECYRVPTRDGRCFDHRVGYQAVHRRLKMLRGPASLQICVLCGEQAYDWAFHEQDSAAPVLVDDRGRYYSLDLDAYRPMCRPCHREIDAPDFCIRGHDLNDPRNVYRHKGGRSRRCRACHREAMRRYRMKDLDHHRNQQGESE